MRQFKDKVCVITGAGSGIGAACARAMAAQGGVIIGTDLRQDMLADTKAAVEAANGRMETIWSMLPTAMPCSTWRRRWKKIMAGLI